MAHSHAMGTLLLIGAVLLSLNALAVSARPGESTTAEKTTTATAAAPTVAGKPPSEPASGGESVPMPLPILNLVTNSSGGLTAVAQDPITYPDDPTSLSGVGTTLPDASVSGPRTPSLGGDVQPGPGLPPVEPPTLPGMGTIPPPAAEPTPMPPITPSPGGMSPAPTPPDGVTPAHEGL